MSEDQSGVVTLKVRVTPEFREKIVETAKTNNRSMNAEIVHRLEQSFLVENEVSELYSMPTPKGFSAATTTQSTPIHNPVANDPRERRRLAKLAAENALKDMSAQDLVDTLFHKLNSEGTRLTVEEVERVNKVNNIAHIKATTKKST